MNSPLKIFVDTSFFKAYIDIKDGFHLKALEIFEELKGKGALLITSNYILDETFTLLRVKCNLEIAIEFKTALEEFETDLKIVRITNADDAAAWDWFVKDWSKLSFTDCTSFALMKRLEIENVAAFDDHFKRAGFSLNPLQQPNQ